MVAPERVDAGGSAAAGSPAIRDGGVGDPRPGPDDRGGRERGAGGERGDRGDEAAAPPAASAISDAGNTAADAGAGSDARDAGPPDAQDAAAPDAQPADAMPDAAPDAAPAPVPDTLMPGAEKPGGVEATEAAGVVIKVIIGLALLFLLAYLGAHPVVRRVEEQLGIAHLVTAGFPFVGLGLIARHPSVNVLSDGVLLELVPVLNFGLGWLGFIIGTKLDMRFLDKLPRGTGVLVVVEASTPFALVALACGAIMVAFGRTWSAPDTICDALVLGAAGAMTAPMLSTGLADSRWSVQAGIEGLVGQLDEIAGVVVLLFIAAIYRPGAEHVAWKLPVTAWVFVTLGLGVCVGLLLFVMVRGTTTGAEFLAVLIGFVAFASGMAGYLQLSPIVVCFIAGVLITNVPTEHRGRLIGVLYRVERPILYVFLIIAGALWDVGDWRGWVLLPAFVASRIAGKWLGVFAGRKSHQAQGLPLPEHGPAIMPISVLSLAIVVNVQSLYQSEAVHWVMTAVIGGAIVTEILIQFIYAPGLAQALGESQRRERKRRREPSAGPVYRELDDVPAGDLADGHAADNAADAAAAGPGHGSARNDEEDPR